MPGHGVRRLCGRGDQCLIDVGHLPDGGIGVAPATGICTVADGKLTGLSGNPTELSDTAPATLVAMSAGCV